MTTWRRAQALAPVALLALAPAVAAQSTDQLARRERALSYEVAGGGSYSGSSNAPNYERTTSLRAGMVGVRWSGGDPGGLRLLAIAISSTADFTVGEPRSGFRHEERAAGRLIAIVGTIHGELTLGRDIVIDPFAGAGVVPYARSEVTLTDAVPGVPGGSTTRRSQEQGATVIALVGVAVRYRSLFLEQQFFFPGSGPSFRRENFNPLLVGWRF